MSWLSPFSRRLYLRIWLAVVGGVLVFAFAVGFAWRWAAEQAEQAQQQQPPTREIVITDGQGRTLVDGMGVRQRGDPGESIRYRIETGDGAIYEMHLSPRTPHTPRIRPDERGPASWFRPPLGFLWMLTLVGLAVTVGVFPIIRRLLQRLEQLQKSVQRFGEGDLSVRAPEQGQDEVADLARQFNASAARIQTLVQSHKSLLANASHELRSPLARIRMGLELLQGGQAAPAGRTEIERSVTELDELVEEILLASRLDAGAADIGAMEPVELLGLAAEECARVDAELLLPAGADAPLELPGNPRLLRRALRNLLENARRYSQGAITLHIGRTGGWAELQVCDHGPGVPPEHLPHLAQAFYRPDTARQRTTGGVGLGLYLCRLVAQAHGGTLQVRNAGPGLSVTVRLPVAG